MIDDRAHERMRWRCRRGVLELDLLFQKFIVHELERLTEQEHAVLQRIVDLPDPELLDYCYGRAVSDDPEVRALVRRIAG